MKTRMERHDNAAASRDADQTSTCNPQRVSTVFEDVRPQALAQRRQSDVVHTSSRMLRQQAVAGALQRKDANVVKAPDHTGLPDRLKTGIESLSGLSMDGVRVHYGSSRPAQLNAYAYAQGTDIHLAPGQEKHLPHEAWHVVQQMQGRVRPTMQLMGTTAINDDAALEAEADLMGAKADSMLNASEEHHGTGLQSLPALGGLAMQRKGRVELDAITDHPQRGDILEAVRIAREKRIKAKMDARLEWLPLDGIEGDKTAIADRDEKYNSAVELARKTYGLDMLQIKQAFSLDEKQFISGPAYYGEEGSNGVWKRSDGKEFVRDLNQVFMPRYARRELNAFDLPKIENETGLEPTGKSKHGTEGSKKAAMRDIPFTDDDREFLQQSIGGGNNQYAFSLTSTKHPILSNDHHNFGAPGKNTTINDPHGRIIVDLQKFAPESRRAQWALAPEEEGGHKIERSGFDEEWMRRRRDKVLASGYRNMEIITPTVPANAVVDKQAGWEEEDDSGKGESAAGQWLNKFRQEKEKP